MTFLRAQTPIAKKVSVVPWHVAKPVDRSITKVRRSQGGLRGIWTHRRTFGRYFASNLPLFPSDYVECK